MHKPSNYPPGFDERELDIEDTDTRSKSDDVFKVDIKQKVKKIRDGTLIHQAI